VPAVCWNCVEDEFLKRIIQNEGEVQLCAECGDDTNAAFTAEELAEKLDPILREHYAPGEEVQRFGLDDEHSWEQEGDPLYEIIQEPLKQSFSFDDEIVEFLIDNDGARPQDGEEPFFSNEINYVPVKLRPYRLQDRWNSVEEDLKHRKRFFSSAAKDLFAYLFDDIESRAFWDTTKRRAVSVIRVLPEGTDLFRARVCDSTDDVKSALTDPFKNVGPPPPTRARAGRMNVDGVAVFYGALESDTCLAELRPALGSETAVITVRATKALRLLDFTRISNSYRILSYFQPDFEEQAERNIFLRRLGRLISQPVRPGREADYLVTQTMAEYLGHVHSQRAHGTLPLLRAEPFDGLLYKSAQKAGGTNVVLFPRPTGDAENVFPVVYVADTARIFRTTAIQYEHDPLDLAIHNGDLYQHSYDDEDDE
jgi:hypothetical protein